jgi:hypothetical protein
MRAVTPKTVYLCEADEVHRRNQNQQGERVGCQAVANEGLALA